MPPGPFAFGDPALLPKRRSPAWVIAVPRLFSAIDPFLLLLAATVLVASVLPPRGAAVPVAGAVADLAVALLFFLHGAKLSRQAIWAGLTHWRLQAAVPIATFVLFPLLGLAVMRALPGLSLPLRMGILYLTLLPSTVQSSIAFTAVAGGNVPAAICAASLSNIAGVVLTPVLVALLMHGGNGGASALPADAVRSIVLQLLLPFVMGHSLRPLIGGFVERHRKFVGRVDRGSILLVVYTAFGAAVVEGLWHTVSAIDLFEILIVSALLLATVMTLLLAASRWLGFAREDEIVLLFCGSKKSLASGVPMAGALFPAAQVGSLVLPLMLFHQLQLFVCAAIAARYRSRSSRT